MKKIAFYLLLIFFTSTAISSTFSRHWFGEIPTTLNKTSKTSKTSLLIHDLFIISFDNNKKFARWIAYQLSPGIMQGHIVAKRNYVPDSFLSKDVSLSKRNYRGAAKFGYQRGHLAPVGSFKNSRFIYQAQYLSNIAPQKKGLNQGPWHKLEQAIRAFVTQGNEIKILTGLLYGDTSYGQAYNSQARPLWPAVNGVIKILPSGFWKIVFFKAKNQVQVCSFLMPQEIKSKKSLKKYVSSLAQLKKHTGLSLLKNVKYQESCKFLL